MRIQSRKTLHPLVLLLGIMCGCATPASLSKEAAIEGANPDLIQQKLAQEEGLSSLFLDGDFTPSLANDPWFRAKVNFWKSIYAYYGLGQGVIHDVEHPEKVFGVIALEPKYTPENRARMRAAESKWSEVLMSVHEKRNSPELLNAEELRVFNMYRDLPGDDRYLHAAHDDRIRVQQGLRERFERAIKTSGQILTQMEEIFRAYGVPVEITRLPFVESSFDLSARSHVGAAGIWQFMRYTGKLYLKMSPAIDERLDPIRATEAAAKLLRANYEELKSWPLAITAYNHGRSGMARAIEQVGTRDFVSVAQSYKSPSFKFASRNFFPEFVAAYEVENQSERYFGKILRDEPKLAFEAILPHYTHPDDLSAALGVRKESLAELNPAILERTWEGKYLIPMGTKIRLPFNWGTPAVPDVHQAITRALDSIPKTRRFAKQTQGVRGLASVR